MSTQLLPRLIYTDSDEELLRPISTAEVNNLIDQLEGQELQNISKESRFEVPVRSSAETSLDQTQTSTLVRPMSVCMLKKPSETAPTDTPVATPAAPSTLSEKAETPRQNKKWTPAKQARKNVTFNMEHASFTDKPRSKRPRATLTTPAKKPRSKPISLPATWADAASEDLLLIQLQDELGDKDDAWGQIASEWNRITDRSYAKKSLMARWKRITDSLGSPPPEVKEMMGLEGSIPSSSVGSGCTTHY
ncbi:hypothetical protein N7462_002838 [Penicillium macrosclerotiorum]|uniref:uncharacterized protein n=1 Tax=Penicillium macrosclerotiorum TaxID=303699 RepID=UPI002548DC4E|nr:uncharacterized protein N7462_002838 [Penicillium macrosclerotiorum]KAJ5693415.1 hypothetical protein N7462_002838 [Penicillium macrosclerotiorum]